MKTLMSLVTIVILLSIYGSKNDLNLNFGLNKKESKQKSILILPLNNGIDEKYMDSALEMLKKEFPEVKIIVGEKTKLPKNCLNHNESRYRADSILVFLSDIKPDTIDKVIGLTSSDISTTRTLMVDGETKTYSDYGILGLGRRPGDVCVVSTYRTKTLETFSKTTIHEFMHTLGVPHCEHKLCIMQDGKGSGKNMIESTHIHKECYELAMKGF